MEDQTRFGGRRSAWCRAAVTGIVGALALAGCGGPAWMTGRATKPDERTAARYCVLDRRAEGSGRVVNYVDPELCGRRVIQRSQSTVRIPPEQAVQNQVYALRHQAGEVQERAAEVGARR